MKKQKSTGRYLECPVLFNVLEKIENIKQKLYFHTHLS